MISGEKLGNVGFQYIGTSYRQMDCQAFVEKCLSDCGLHKDLPGSNAWFREVRNNGWVGTPEDCVKRYGTVPVGAFLFILLHDGKEPEKYKPDGLGNASHMGLCTGTRGEGAIHSSSSRGCVCESKFKNKTIPNGGWNMVGLWNPVEYDEALYPPEEPDLPVLRNGSRGEYVTLLQTKLIQQGYDLSPYGADGVFGNKTMNAVKNLQRNNGLEVDGIVGKNTWAVVLSGETKYYTVSVPHLSQSVAEEIVRKYGGSMIAEE